MNPDTSQDPGHSDFSSPQPAASVTGPSRRDVLRGAGVGALGIAGAFILPTNSYQKTAHTIEGISKAQNVATMAVFGSIGPTLTPNLTGNGVARAVTQCFGSSLLGYDKNLKLIPALATSYQMSSDGMTYTFHLRKGVKWSDGKPFTADDIEAAILAMTDPATTTNWISYVSAIVGTTDRKAGKASTVSGYKKVDATTFTVTLTAPSASFLDLFGNQFQPIPKHVTDSIAPNQLNTGTFGQAPNVGIGPFYLTSRSSDDTMTMARNPHYWGGPASLNQLVVKSMTETNAVTAILAGEVDVIPGETVAEINPSDVVTLQANRSIKITQYPNNTTQTLYMNFFTQGANSTTPSKFSDLRVRQAVMYALDRQGMIKTILNGKAVVPDSVYPPFSPYYNRKVLTLYKQNVSKAKQLLEEAGWDPNTSLDFVVGTGDAVVTQAATIIQQQLKAIGMNVKIDQTDNNTAVSRLIKSHSFDLGIASNVGANNLDVSRRFASNQRNAGVNSGGYSNPQLDALMTEALAKSTMAQQKPLTDQIQKIISQDIPTVMLWFRDSIAAVDTAHVSNVVPQRGGAWLRSNKWKRTKGA